MQKIIGDYLIISGTAIGPIFNGDESERNQAALILKRRSEFEAILFNDWDLDSITSSDELEHIFRDAGPELEFYVDDCHFISDEPFDTDDYYGFLTAMKSEEC